jgi:hypothetical protein
MSGRISKATDQEECTMKVSVSTWTTHDLVDHDLETAASEMGRA